ncbi:hypothetical protein MMC2321_02417 [Chitinophaga sp. MM2321]
MLGSYAASGQALIALVFGKKITNSKLHLGIYLGASSSWIDGASGQMPRYGFAIGAYTIYDLNTHWQLAMDIVMRSPKGAKQLRYENSFVVPDDAALIGEDFNRLLTYMSFTPLIRYKLTPSWGIAAGPYVAARTKAKDIYGKDTENGTLYYYYNSKKDIHLADAGASFDIQYILMKGKGMHINAQFNLGLTNFYKDKNTHAYHRQILLGVGIPIGNR